MQENKYNEQHFWSEIRKNHPDYLRWFIADTASALGASFIAIPISLASLYITGDLSQAGIVGAASAAGSMMMTIPAGMIIDRFDKKKLLCLYGLTQFLVWGLFTVLLYQDKFTFFLLLIFSSCSGMIIGVFGGLTNAILRFIIPENLLVAAQGRNQTRDNAIWLTGLPLGGFLFGLAPVIPFMVQALSGLGPLWAAKTLTTNLKPTSTGQSYSVKNFVADAKYSLSWIWRYPILRLIFSIDIFTNFANFYLIVAIDLWLAYLGIAGWIIGFVSAMFTLGMLVGGLLQDNLIQHLPGKNIVQARLAWELFWYLFLIIFSGYWPLIAVAAFFIVIPSVAGNSYSGSYLALSAPPEKIGKCAAGARLIMGLLPVAASISAGILLRYIGFQMSMFLCVLCLTVACFLAASTTLKSLPESAQFDQIPVCE
ncbi:MFS transporter [Corynebacterium kutscheri]|uniref:Arabinose efflux permease family protein n=1 Tax=Corynebacterium kutscheri TaxID=35755 RepID=A0A0F6R1G9_9CORY|nr:MFS transporter [Corynebacterium kutscheri]AKE41845.1 arabinose efflux permease family protein [Corynebacterium kutscheri]VEH10173.1 H+ Antiporter protein [Corynebacterium kutscheri]